MTVIYNTLLISGSIVFHLIVLESATVTVEFQQYLLSESLFFTPFVICPGNMVMTKFLDDESTKQFIPFFLKMRFRVELGFSICRVGNEGGLEIAKFP